MMPDTYVRPSERLPGQERSAAATASNLQTLTAQFAQTRSPHLRKALILYHQRLVFYVASRFLGSGESLDDLIQVGNIGLINALDRFDPSRDIKFSAYAMPTIVGEIKRHFRDKTWHIKVPRRLQEMSLSARKAQQILATRLNRPPTVREVAAEIGVSEEEALEALEINAVSSALSLDSCLDSHNGGDGSTLMDVIGRIDGALHDIEAYADLRRALGLLDSREHEVVRLRFFEELSQANIAHHLGLSQMHVSRLQQRALERLHCILAENVRRPAAPVRPSLPVS
jgi:RNA polymerase sigma-B factor